MSDESNRTALTADQILDRGRQRRIKEVAYMGGIVYAHGMTRLESKAYRDESIQAAGSVAADEYQDERLVMHMIRDVGGVPIFSEKHLTRMADMNEADFRPLLLACMEVNGWGPQAQDEIRKNSETRSAASTSA